MARIKMNDKDKKTEIVPVRCTKAEKKKYEEKASKIGKSISNYLEDCGIAGLERRSCREKKRLAHNIRLAEMLNLLRYEVLEGSLDEKEELIIDCINKIEQEVVKLWDY